MLTRTEQQASNASLAQKVDEHLQGQQAAARVIEDISDNCGDGDQFYRAVVGAGAEGEPFRAARLRGFCRYVQKTLERSKAAHGCPCQADKEVELVR